MNTEELAQFLTDKDVFISSSCYEQFSLAAVESMAGLVPICDRRNRNVFIYKQRI